MLLRRAILLGLLLLGAAVSLRASVAGADTGFTARDLIQRTDPDALATWGTSHPWLRIRDVLRPGTPAKADAVRQEREALLTLRDKGFRPIPFLRWAKGSWEHGARRGGGHRLPTDLRDAYRRAKAYSEAYGDAVAGFEFDNEPDITFVEDNAETYAAYLKACALGVRAGQRSAAPGEKPWTVMAPLALPPGAYFEQLVENGFLDYTDAFNYHYYGYAEDFSGVYRLFDEAVAETAKLTSTGEPVGDGAEKRELPVLLTEYGYGSLDGVSRDTVAGRVQQWTWFCDVGRQIEALRVAGPMAFLVRPYLENNAIEFGLTMPPKPAPPENGTGPKEHAWTAGGLRFRPEDFGSSEVAPWMRRIGERIGGNEAAPALAWLLEEGRSKPYVPRNWTVPAARPSPVVIDFSPGPSLAQLKRYGGYLAQGAPEQGQSVVTGNLVVYNFGDTTVRGTLRWEGATDAAGKPSRELTLPPLGRALVWVQLRIPAGEFRRMAWPVRFVPAEPAVPAAKFATHFYPSLQGMVEKTVVTRFNDPAEATAANRELIQRLPRPAAEPARHQAGRWLVTEGVTLTELAPGRWQLLVVPYAGSGPRRAMAELPLPEGFRFPPGAVLMLRHRLNSPPGRNFVNGKYLCVYFRTQNGNLYGVWPWLRTTAAWGDAMEAQEAYTLMFYGRAERPWRFGENRPVSLVLEVGMGDDPLEFEIVDPRIVQISAGRAE